MARRGFNNTVKFIENPLRPFRAWERYGDEMLNGYIDLAKSYFAERSWFERGALTRKGLILAGTGERHWYPCQKRKNSNWF